MDYIVISLAALVVAALTLFSGFGLGTLLMPVFAIFVPVEMAVAATAVVHLANNIFKAILVGKGAKLRVVVMFALPAAAFAAAGAWILGRMTAFSPIHGYSPVKIVIALLILVFAVVEMFPKIFRFKINMKLIPFGGALSGFFGGLSGHQGALRSAFLINLGLTKEQFIGTAVLSAIVVDVSRISVYGSTFISRDISVLEKEGLLGLMLAGMVAAFVGSFIGARLMKKVTMRVIQTVVGIMLIGLAFALGLGII
jgi:uncharacterized membrane protein YfcA